jgi:hypothetical protein
MSSVTQTPELGRYPSPTRLPPPLEMIQMALHCYISAYKTSELAMLLKLMSFVHLKIHWSFQLRFLVPKKSCMPECFETSRAGLTRKPALGTRSFSGWAGTGDHLFICFFYPAHSIHEWTFPAPVPSSSLSFSPSLPYSYELLGFPIHDKCTAMRGRDVRYKNDFK